MRLPVLAALMPTRVAAERHDRLSGKGGIDGTLLVPKQRPLVRSARFLAPAHPRQSYGGALAVVPHRLGSRPAPTRPESHRLHAFVSHAVVRAPNSHPNPSANDGLLNRFVPAMFEFGRGSF